MSRANESDANGDGISRRTFLKVAAALGVGAALGGCAGAAQRLEKLERRGRPPFVAGITLVPFQEYSPDPSAEKLGLDRMLEAYISQPLTIEELRGLTYFDSMEIGFLPESRIEIKDYDRFESGVISTAEELGVSLKELKELSIHDALMLSGKITAHRLYYDREMITNKKKARKVDNSPEDEIFFNGSSVCRNYAAVNCGVFGVEKNLNPNLKNTYIRWYAPTGMHYTILRHAWNLASTLTRGDEDLEILMTYIDPTILDTKDRTADNTGKKLEHASDEELYNGLDEHHFFKGMLLAQKYLGDLYKTLGNPDRERLSKLFTTSREAIRFYMKKTFEQRMKICDVALDVATTDLEYSFLCASYFKKSFKDGWNLTEVHRDYVSAELPAMQKDLLRVYRRGKKIIPELLGDFVYPSWKPDLKRT